MKRPHIAALIATVLVSIICVSCNSKSFYSVNDSCQFVLNGAPQYFVGTNLWYAGRLAQTDPSRLEAELDTLCSIGVTNLRVLAVDADTDGLAKALEMMRKRGMCAVLFLNNAWEWSKGFADYMEEAGLGRQPRPSTDGYQAYMEAMSGFCCSQEAIALSHEHIRNVVTRFKDDPAVFSWQIANEPRAFSQDPDVQEAFVKYIHSTASFIKSLDHNHMVSTGNEGEAGCEWNRDLFVAINDCPDIDYVTIHIWPYNWGWVKDSDIVDGVEGAIAATDNYIDSHLIVARELGKPMVIEEFGYARDGFQFKQGTPTTARDRYYSAVFDRVARSSVEGDALAGANFWGWGGLARQTPGHVYWQEGDDLCGDPEQEQQGLNSVYAGDRSTIDIILYTNQLLLTTKNINS